MKRRAVGKDEAGNASGGAGAGAGAAAVPSGPGGAEPADAQSMVPAGTIKVQIVISKVPQVSEAVNASTFKAFPIAINCFSRVVCVSCSCSCFPNVVVACFCRPHYVGCTVSVMMRSHAC